jgi:ketosteroid isomerase-like protein
VKSFQLPSGSDLTALFGDDSAWTAYKVSIEPFVEPDCQFALVAWGQRLEYTGVDRFRQGWFDWLTPWASYRSETQDVLDVGDQVVVLVRDRGRRHDMDAELEMFGAGVCLVRNGKIARADFYASQAEALEAVGLSGTDARSHISS